MKKTANANAEKKPFKQRFDEFFGISRLSTSVRTEIIAGVVTFLAMAYILTLNPSLITSDWTNSTPFWASVFLATALGAFIGTLLMALVAKMPLAQAPGLGLNSTLGALLGEVGALGFHVSFGNAMLIVLISGILFLLLSVIKVKGITIREKIFDGIPLCVRGSISVGIGLFIAFIGMQNSGIIVASESTKVTLASFNNYSVYPAAAVVCLFGLIVIALLDYFKVKGGVIIGIIAATVLGIPLGVTQYSNMTWEFWTYFQNFFSFDATKEAAETGATFFAVFTEGFKWDANATIMPIIMTTITFCMIDMFDTMGTSVGCCAAADLLDENQKPLHYDGIMISDSVATVAGAMLGTSTVTTFVESGSGVAAGGRTGLTALTTAVCFLLSIFLLPLFASIPSAAASSALLYVGCLMLKNIKLLKFENIKHLIPAFLTMAMMPLAYSITTGIGFGIISYVVIEFFSFIISFFLGKRNKYGKIYCNVSVVTWVVFVLFVVYFVVPTTF